MELRQMAFVLIFGACMYLANKQETLANFVMFLYWCDIQPDSIK